MIFDNKQWSKADNDNDKKKGNYSGCVLSLESTLCSQVSAPSCHAYRREDSLSLEALEGKTPPATLSLGSYGNTDSLFYSFYALNITTTHKECIPMANFSNSANLMSLAPSASLKLYLFQNSSLRTSQNTSFSPSCLTSINTKVKTNTSHNVSRK